MVSIPVSIGELIDKLSILHVKIEKIKDENKLIFIKSEYNIIYEISYKYLQNEEISQIYKKLIETNLDLWDIEDKLRLMEKDKLFNNEFIELARSVYYTNDNRFLLKDKINNLLDSEIKEQKEYVKYL